MIMIDIFCATVVFIFVCAFFKYKRYCDLINNIPGPRPQPIIGNFWMFNVPTDKLWNVFRRMNNCYYPITRYWLGPVPFIAIRHPDDLEVVLSNSNHIEKGFTHKLLHPWLKTGLLNSTGNKWRHRCQILEPAFRSQALQAHLCIFENNSKKFIECLKNDNKEILLNLMSLFTNYTLNTISESLMGVASNFENSDTVQGYTEALSTFRDVMAYSCQTVYSRLMLRFSSKICHTQKSALKTLHRFTQMILENRKQCYESSRDECFAKLDNGKSAIDSENLIKESKPKLTMLDLLLNAKIKGTIDTEGIKEEMDTLVFAGHDTTTVAFVFTTMLLAENEDIPVTARQEVNNVFSMHKGDLFLKIQELNYLERCIKESLRLYPPVLSISRRLRKNINLRRYLIPAETDIGCSIFDVHRDPNFWPNPTRYDPDRFLPENIKSCHPYAYIPFGTGPRRCIGQKFAMMKVKCLIAHILLNFKIQPVTELSSVNLKFGILTLPSMPEYSKFTKIDH